MYIYSVTGYPMFFIGIKRFCDFFITEGTSKTIRHKNHSFHHLIGRVYQKLEIRTRRGGGEVMMGDSK